MRPIRLELSGFTAFRDPVEIAFDDAAYFAFVGPTGSGKSSLIDAMTFALYGSVPRLDRRSVHPVITQGQLEARVRFDFGVGDEEYTAVRVVRKTAAGASTKECRLEREGEVLAGDPDGLTAEVERILGLSYDHFIKCVVLPQGAFAQFLHDKPADRGDLLVKLLDLGVYEQMQQRAGVRAADADKHAEHLKRRLDEELAFATPEAKTELQQRLSALEQLLETIRADEPRVEELREIVRSTREVERTALERIEALAALRVPADVADLAAELTKANEACRGAEERLGAAEDVCRLAEKAGGELPAREPLEEARAAHRLRKTCETDLKSARRSSKAATTEHAAAEEAFAVAQKDAEAAAEAWEAARLEHRAHDLAGELRAGEPCPVCRQDVHEVPALVTPADLEAAEQKHRAAQAGLATAGDRLSETQRSLTSTNARTEQLAEQLSAHDEAVRAHPDAAAVDEALAEIGRAHKAQEAARKDESAARREHALAQKTLEAARKSIDGSWRALDAARDRVASLSPPPLERKDPTEDWRALAAWAVEQAEREKTGIGDAVARKIEAETEGVEMLQRQKAACTQLGIEDAERPRDASVGAIASAKASLERIELALEATDAIRAERAELEVRAAVAGQLSQHLKANAFEAWILDEALRVLQEGATEILADLSAGQYSLTLDKNRNFAVVDHRNASEVRSARTLSGGETFLASLALALALADRIAQLSANSAVRLESIFLDEGFGSLDPETMDTVEAAIANLAATGRVVGIVTHVRDLAERVPVRYEVRKGPTTSTVEKVLA